MDVLWYNTTVHKTALMIRAAEKDRKTCPNI